MGKNQNSVVGLRIRVKFWWMIPMDVKYNHTKFERETQRWRPGTGFASGYLNFKNCSLGPKSAICGPKKPRNTFKTVKRRETVGTLHVRLDFPVSTSSLWPSNSMICPGNGPTRPPQALNADSHKPRKNHIFGYMAQNAIPRAPAPPATPHFLWSPPLRIAQRTPRPQYLGPLGSSSCKLKPKQVRAQMGQQGPVGAKR